MSICNDIIKKEFKQFTYSDKQKLEILLKTKYTKKYEIAELLRKTVRSINREKITRKEIKRIEYWINNYPVEVFNYKIADNIVKLHV